MDHPSAVEAAEVPGQRLHVRPDFALIGEMVEPGSRVLDVGCETGALLDYLIADRNVIGRGIELSQAGVNESVRRGLSVVQGDADTDLQDYPSKAFDYVILSQTLQATYHPREVLSNLVRIGRRAIVSFPNFGHWRVRLKLLWQGTMPVSEALPGAWYETPNIHLCTIRDFLSLSEELGITVERALALDEHGSDKGIAKPTRANLRAEHALFLLRADESPI
ncbi:methionine biosynthesis protein MetW [Rhodovibrio salinarum]|uniref:Methionine biosynthesis protein MetW n=1 Tax=Rhodovibrio salinarum TaxID=1087 RepID=A0A934QHD5_9PROT|nr:methionine biosynthesis protein MetW [Rhodovibrio salinarum]MBK1696819.1 methionine biosynthesis protein MetW [Rhodovibrio salinarum]